MLFVNNDTSTNFKVQSSAELNLSKYYRYDSSDFERSSNWFRAIFCLKWRSIQPFITNNLVVLIYIWASNMIKLKNTIPTLSKTSDIVRFNNVQGCNYLNFRAIIFQQSKSFQFSLKYGIAFNILCRYFFLT